ncbi:MAG: hypothetical protein K6A74_09935 [Lachnospiraceae bacterium]|nr:hypothetical protein [Lachnospiraceae bacterium]
MYNIKIRKVVESTDPYMSHNITDVGEVNIMSVSTLIEAIETLVNVWYAEHINEIRKDVERELLAETNYQSIGEILEYVDGLEEERKSMIDDFDSIDDIIRAYV